MKPFKTAFKAALVQKGVAVATLPLKYVTAQAVVAAVRRG